MRTYTDLRRGGTMVLLPIGSGHRPQRRYGGVAVLAALALTVAWGTLLPGTYLTATADLPSSHAWAPRQCLFFGDAAARGALLAGIGDRAAALEDACRTVCRKQDAAAEDATLLAVENPGTVRQRLSAACTAWMTETLFAAPAPAPATVPVVAPMVAASVSPAAPDEVSDLESIVSAAPTAPLPGRKPAAPPRRIVAPASASETGHGQR